MPAPVPSRPPTERPARGYFEVSRSLAASFVFVVPLLALYQVALLVDPGIRNGTLPLLRELFYRVSHVGLAAVNVVVLAMLILAIHRSRGARSSQGLYGAMFLEACGWTVVLRGIQVLLVPPLLEAVLALPPTAQSVLGYVGAGLYEEFVFRFLLLGGLVVLLHRGLGAPRAWIVPLAILMSAAVFSYAHHGLGSEPFTWGAFVYRTVMGVALGCVYCRRGLGIVVYTHALYNISLLVPL